MINTQQLRDYVITPALSKLNSYSKAAEELLVFTCATESNGGEYIHQIQGPALGIYQCEPATHTDMWRNYIVHHSRYVSMLTLKFNVNGVPAAERLITDLDYATAICRIHYLRVREALPDGRDPEAMYEYYKKYYNTHLGRATKKKSIDAYLRATDKSPYPEKIVMPNPKGD